ncbi:hypothetical protein CK203_080677 [Vitis vinifera]|uniref:Uncharacterized protein n=1 Tax=Vitis vinifera TaxID=29760 RepID=A0A438DZ44_VITVI|nr:hypothetical protein CK203_080677 [Vitis vinifera]
MIMWPVLLTFGYGYDTMMGFRKKWLGWMKWSIFTASTRLPPKGSCGWGFFSAYTGERVAVGASFKYVTAWDGVEERFQKRLAMWKRQYISKEGRITLIRSTLASLPIYFMFMLSIPRLVRLRQVKDGYGVGLWKAIRKEWHIVCIRLSFVVGKRRVKFLEG